MNEINEVETSKTEMTEHEARRAHRRRGRSMFVPISLITAGVYLLLANLEVLPEPKWRAILPLWPLLLVFIGLNLIVRQVSRPIGTWLSLLVALAAVGLFSYVIFYGEQIKFLDEYKLGFGGELFQESLSFSSDGVVEANIDLVFDDRGAELFVLEDSANLIEADISYYGSRTFDTDLSDGEASVFLDTKGTNVRIFGINLDSWTEPEGSRPWDIGLLSGVPMDLLLDLASGRADLELAGLSLTELEVIGGNGSTYLYLPDGDYDMVYDVRNGSVDIVLPAGGRHAFEIEGGNGSLLLDLPESMEMRLDVYDDGNGILNIEEARLILIEDGSGDEGVWETRGYRDTVNRVELRLDIKNGSVTIR